MTDFLGKDISPNNNKNTQHVADKEKPSQHKKPFYN